MPLRAKMPAQYRGWQICPTTPSNFWHIISGKYARTSAGGIITRPHQSILTLYAPYQIVSYEVRERHKICLLDTINQGVAKDNVLKTGIKLYKYDHKTIKINTSWYYMSHTFLQMNLVDEEGGYKTTHQ